MTIRRLLAATAMVSALMTGASVAQTSLSMWYHGAGDDAALAMMNRIIGDFNASQSDWQVTLESFPQGAYNDAVGAAALAGRLPDILDVDGPIMPNWAWAGYLAPLDIDESKLAGYLPSAAGRWNDQLYCVGLWDAAVGIAARRSVLEANDIRIPTVDEPWTGEEFDAALVTIKESGEFDYPISLGMANKGEWYSYAFSPFLASFGGDLVDRETYLTADGVINGDAAVEFGEWFQSLFERGLAQGTSQDPADWQTGFDRGRFAMNLTGNWRALPSIAAFGDDVIFLPAPDFGHGAKIGAASWQFAVSATSEHQEGGNAFVEFMLQDQYRVGFSDSIGFIPATPEAAAESKNYSPGGPLVAFYELNRAHALLRPVTPGYIVSLASSRR